MGEIGEEGRRIRPKHTTARRPAPTRVRLSLSTQPSVAALLDRLATRLTPPPGTPPDRAGAAALLAAAAGAPPFPASARVSENRVPGCAAAAWVTASLRPDGTLLFAADADAALTKGAAVALAAALTGATPADVAALTATAVEAAGLPAAALPPSRAGGAAALVASFKARARSAAAGGGPPPFPSLVVGRGGALAPRGAFAEAQAAYLSPSPSLVSGLAADLAAARVGVVAHFYMDPEVQGALAAAAAAWPHIKISDSLAMADAAVGMAAAGVTAIAVLGVDFMSENVRAILDDAGHTDVQVLRMSPSAIGCTLADAADAAAYREWLTTAGPATGGPCLHVVYINTSLSSKAAASATLPTITCTSSNVVSTVLTAAAESPGVRILYGPDAYMGANLVTLLTRVAGLGDEAARALHPAHDAASLKRVASNLTYFRHGLCAVHDLFGDAVATTVVTHYGDALLAAHFEVPGELFGMALERMGGGEGAPSPPSSSSSTPPRGVVGSTQNILDFILARLTDALASPAGDRVRVVLGTETGMVTSIVRGVTAALDAGGRDDVDVEIIFPVAADAVTTAGATVGEGGAAPTLPGGLALVPGPPGGEGCSSSGGCASCPYMKMNTLIALRAAVAGVAAGDEGVLAPLRAARRADALPGGGGGGASVAALGCAPILHMRHFQRTGHMPPALIEDIARRGKGQ